MTNLDVISSKARRQRTTSRGARDELELAARRAEDAKLRAELKADENPGQKGAMKAFELFAEERSNRTRRQLGERAIETYKGIWLQWLMYLAGIDVRWREATPANVLGFLNSRKHRRRARVKEGCTAEVTRGRYARVLQDIYLFAARDDEAIVNPVKEGGTGIEVKEVEPSLYLSPGIRMDLHRRYPPMVDAESARDRAIICLALLEGLTCSDIIELKLSSLLFNDRDLEAIGAGVPNEHGDGMRPAFPEGTKSGSLLKPAAPPVGVHVRGARKAQDRRVKICSETGRALSRWLELRSDVARAASTDALVLSLSRRQSRKSEGPVATHSVLFKVCRQHLDDALAGSAHLDAQQIKELAHIGPNVLRNACILDWLSKDVPVDEVRRRAGVKDARSLHRLIELINGEKGNTADR